MFSGQFEFSVNTDLFLLMCLHLSEMVRMREFMKRVSMDI